jgi:hypothetical protein
MDAMTTLITKRSGPHSRMEAEDDPVAEPWPMAFIGIVVLLVGDVALTLAAIAAIG